jgi:CheY-like chemotaxis protein
MRILIAEDVFAFRHLLEGKLDMWGYKVAFTRTEPKPDSPLGRRRPATCKPRLDYAGV